MKTGQHYDLLVIGGEQYAVRKAAKHSPTNRGIDERILERMALNGLELRLTILKKQLKDLLQIPVELLEGVPLLMCTRESRNVADENAGLGVLLDYGCKGFHRIVLSGRTANLFRSCSSRNPAAVGPMAANAGALPKLHGADPSTQVRWEAE